MEEQYYKGVLAAFLRTKFFDGLVSEWQIDMVKEDISYFCESQIDHSSYSYQEKEKQKHQIKQSLEVYIQGVKDELRAEVRVMFMLMDTRYFSEIIVK